LTLYDENGRATPESSMTSAMVLRAFDGEAAVEVAADPQPGNWIRPPAGRFSAVLRLYDTPVAASARALERSAMPRIERVACQ
jgi:hypothetical protein